MPNLVLPTRTLYVVNKAIDLFHHRGFHLIGVDRIVRESEITKATFYNYFHSKEYEYQVEENINQLKQFSYLII